MVSDKDLRVVEQHTIDSLNSSFCRLGSLVMHKPIPARVSSLVRGDLAREHITKRRKGVVQSLKQERVAGSVTW